MKALRYIMVLLLIIFLAYGCAREKEVTPTLEGPTPIQEDVDAKREAEQAQEILEVDLTEDKQMVPDSLDIKKGATVRWYNKDDERFYHNLLIYPADKKVSSIKDVLVQSGNINPGDYWEYTFEESGEYKVKDIYSGTMRGKITAEVTKELEKGKVIGKISVK